MAIDKVQLAIKVLRDIKGDDASTSTRAKSMLIDLIIRADKRLKSNECVICDLINRTSEKKNKEKEKIEEHHIAGRKNYPDTLSLCLTHHTTLSEEQLKWNREPETEAIRLSYYFYGWVDLSHLLWTETQIPFFQKVKRKLAYKAWNLCNDQSKR